MAPEDSVEEVVADPDTALENDTELQLPIGGDLIDPTSSLMNAFAWFEVRTVPTGQYRRLMNWARESVIPRHPKLKQQFTSEFSFNKNRASLDRSLDLEPQHPLVISENSRSDHWRYEYRSLDANQFRCLDLLPGQSEDPLGGSFTAADLAEELDFEAISYKWNLDGSCEYVKLDNGELEVTHEVTTMLRRLRFPDRSRRLWIDTICINQADRKEKAVQVKLMGKIYDRAPRTIIWLGDANYTTEAAFSLLHDMDRICSDFYPSIFDFEVSSEAIFARPEFSHQEPRRTALHSLLCHGWFTRTWILQEVLLASNAHIYCGTFSMEWTKIESIVLLLCARGHSETQEKDFPQSWTLFHLHHELAQLKPTLLDLLFLSRNNGTSEPKDKVFGVLGLATDQKVFQDCLDYEHDSAEVTFTKVAGHYVCDGVVSVLNLASNPSFRNYRAMPSWVPDWSSDAVNSEFVRAWLQSDSITAQHNRIDCRTKPHLLPDGTTLVVHGEIVDELSATGRTITTMNSLASSFLSRESMIFLENWRYLTRRLKKFSTYENLDEAFARLIVLNRQVHGAQCSFMSMYTAWVKDMQDLESEYPQYPLHVFHYVRLMKLTCQQRCFFITNGGYMGIGPYFIRPGDKIAQVDGGHTLFVLRKAKDGAYKLIGDACIQGRMNLDHNRANLRDIHLI